MFSISNVRASARDALRGNWGMGILVCFLASLISTVISYIPVLGVVVAILIAGPLMYGVYAYFLKVVRGERAELSDMFSGFPLFGGTLVLYLLQTIFILLWTLLLIVPGIIASLRYAMAFFIMYDNPGISALDAIRQSKEMMQGHKLSLFLLLLSFIGWALLCILTLGIGFLWLYPYVQASLAAFYEEIKAPSYATVPHETPSM
ncbi:DUF975 family protein [Paenibacillus sp.]|uniref:DUF975 family protein n=1 Tax=Paenibacillus sp. TaxID=58172 RepID=UPI002D4108CB|nr:DUF975 family protein [Paenibacillus sp.]HZG57623.1 DUF975 family protein [Paenibacillus sp.]